MWNEVATVYGLYMQLSTMCPKKLVSQYAKATRNGVMGGCRLSIVSAGLCERNRLLCWLTVHIYEARQSSYDKVFVGLVLFPLSEGSCLMQLSSLRVSDR